MLTKTKYQETEPEYCSQSQLALCKHFCLCQICFLIICLPCNLILLFLLMFCCQELFFHDIHHGLTCSIFCGPFVLLFRFPSIRCFVSLSCTLCRVYGKTILYLSRKASYSCRGLSYKLIVMCVGVAMRWTGIFEILISQFSPVFWYMKAYDIPCNTQTWYRLAPQLLMLYQFDDD